MLTEPVIKYLTRLGDRLDGLPVRIIRQSGKTGGYTVELLETRGAYTEGTRINVHGYELEDPKP